jgi:hypothetical protein
VARIALQLERAHADIEAARAEADATLYGRPLAVRAVRGNVNFALTQLGKENLSGAAALSATLQRVQVYSTPRRATLPSFVGTCVLNRETNANTRTAAAKVTQCGWILLGLCEIL